MIATTGSWGSGPLGVVSTAVGSIVAASAGVAEIAAAPVATPAVFRNERRLNVFMKAPLVTPHRGLGDTARSPPRKDRFDRVRAARARVSVRGERLRVLRR